MAEDKVTVWADGYVPGAGENAGIAVAAAAGVLGLVVGGVVAAVKLLAPQPVKTRASRRQGTAQKRFRGVVTMERFRDVEERYFMNAPQANRPSARVHVWYL